MKLLERIRSEMKMYKDLLSDNENTGIEQSADVNAFEKIVGKSS